MLSQKMIEYLNGQFSNKKIDIKKL